MFDMNEQAKFLAGAAIDGKVDGYDVSTILFAHAAGISMERAEELAGLYFDSLTASVYAKRDVARERRRG